MSKKTSQNINKKNKSKSKDRFLESIIAQKDAPSQNNQPGQIKPGQNTIDINTQSSVLKTTMETASSPALTKELTYIGIISFVLILALTTTSFIF
tara:strand:- start:72 stop:356 length:285 start_codon:yes stop_codon:yes gene_type:complete